MNLLHINIILLSIAISLNEAIISVFRGLADLGQIILRVCEDEEVTDECDDLNNEESCDTFGGIDCLFIRAIKHNDLEAQSATVDAATCTMPGVTGDGTTWCKMELAEGSTYSFTGDAGGGNMTLNINGIFAGVSPSQTKTFNSIYKRCNFEMAMSTNNCEMRYIGADFINGAFRDYNTKLNAGVSQTGGTSNGDGPAGALNWTATGRCLPLYIDQSKEDFENANT